MSLANFLLVLTRTMNHEPIILNVVIDGKGGEYCHLYNQQEEIERAARKPSEDIERKIGMGSLNALVTVA